MLLSARGSAGIASASSSPEAKSEASQLSRVPTAATPDIVATGTGTSDVPDGLLGVVQSPTPLPAGRIESGTASNPILSSSQPSNGVETDTAATGGIEVDLTAPYRQRYGTFPAVREWENLRVDGDVVLTDGSSTNQVGLGCVSAEGSLEYSFLVSAPARRAIMEVTGPDAVGSSPTIAAAAAAAAVVAAPNRGDSLSIACAQSDGGTQLLVAVNGTPVASVLVHCQASFWGPTVSLCSCFGPGTARFVKLDTRAH